MRRSERYIVNGHVVNRNGGGTNSNESAADYGFQRRWRNEPQQQQRRYYRPASSFRSYVSSCFKYASWRRIGFLAVISSIFIITNPANGILTKLLGPLEPTPGIKGSVEQQHRQKRKLRLLKINSKVLPKRITNYGLFSLQEEKLQQGLRFFMLQQSWFCDYYDSDFGVLCEVIGKNMAHGKPLIWDPKDRVHTAHRILCGLLIFSSLVIFCFPRAPRYLLFGGNPYLDGLASVFYRPRIVLDLFHANMSVYPALAKMSRILPELKRDSLILSFFSWNDYNDKHLHDFEFTLYVLLLVFVIGGGCNIAASRITDRNSLGFDTVVAASLAYIHRISMSSSRNPILFHVLGQPVTAIGGYWSNLALCFARNHSNGNWITFFVAWLLAGFIGSALAKYHVENIQLFGDIFKLFGWS